MNSQNFQLFIMLFIVLNMFQMALDFEGAPPVITNFLRYSNYVFTTVFLVECGLKLFAYSSSYFQDTWNKFDFFVVIASLFDLALEFVDSDDMKDMPIGSIAKVLRVLRVSRVLRLVNKSKGLQALVRTITMSVTALLNVFMLLLLILFMFAVLGVFFFSELTENPSGEEKLNVIDKTYKNFINFGSSYLLLFAISTGEDWNVLMYDCVDTSPDCFEGKTCGTAFAPVYYICFIMVVTHVMLNLFILVIIQQFETYYVADDNPIKTFNSNFEVFHEVWVERTKKHKVVRIRERDVIDFFKNLPTPLGFCNESGGLTQHESEMKKEILKMGVRSDNGWVYFNELLYRSMRRVFGNFKLGCKMQIIELKTQFRIYMLTHDMSKGVDNNEAIVATLVRRDTSMNPFVSAMYYRISFHTWYKQTMAAKKPHQ